MDKQIQHLENFYSLSLKEMNLQKVIVQEWHRQNDRTNEHTLQVLRAKIDLLKEAYAKKKVRLKLIYLKIFFKLEIVGYFELIKNAHP